MPMFSVWPPPVLPALCYRALGLSSRTIPSQPSTRHATTASLAGKTALITGGTNGLGLETAHQLLTQQVARIIISARDDARGAAAVVTLRRHVQELRSGKGSRPEPDADGAGDVDVGYLLLDLNDYWSGLRFAQTVKREVPQLDVLLCNAGINTTAFRRSSSGHESTMQVNCYTHFLIALTLLPLLRATASHRQSPSHLTFTSSRLQALHSLYQHPLVPAESALARFDDAARYSATTRYADSKLVISAFLRALGRRVSVSAPPGTLDVVVNSFCPGFVATSFDRHMPLWLRVPLAALRWTTARSVRDGGTAAIEAVIGGRDTHGRFLQGARVGGGAQFLDTETGREFSERLWADIVSDVAAVDPDLHVYAK